MISDRRGGDAFRRLKVFGSKLTVRDAEQTIAEIDIAGIVSPWHVASTGHCQGKQV
jgi:hypothetical protein